MYICIVMQITEKNMKSPDINKLKMQSLLSLLILGLGILLVIYMIVVEDEPGAIPLLLIITGTSWFFVTRFRIKTLRKLNEQNSQTN
ncbi:MAG TPA: hypothetical protein VFU05_01430 [Cyclobacteriaceae bacterium]|nr:hypothetical protein [Cyclobacteriaceae bacterium]